MKLSEKGISIRCGEVLEELKKMESESVDLVITSPPYNLLNSTGSSLRSGNSFKWKNAQIQNGYKSHNDSMKREDYIEWMRECIAEMFRVLKPNGAIFFNHKFRVQGGLMEGHPFLDGFNVRQMIIWARAGGFNFNDTYFLPTYEVIYLMPKTPKGKDAFRLIKGANRKTDIWKINQERNNPHPAPFPVELVDNILTSCEGNIVLDPFAGSGTTGISAIKNGWDCILIDNSNEYCEMAKKRIEEFNYEGE
jgi:site-specific DNA-methyltransferase (adenine-specific)